MATEGRRSQWRSTSASGSRRAGEASRWREAVALSLVRRHNASGEMRIAFGEASVGDELVRYFRLNDCVVGYVGRNTVSVVPRQALRNDAARLELEGLLRVWRKLHPEAIVSVPGEAEPIVS